MGVVPVLVTGMTAEFFCVQDSRSVVVAINPPSDIVLGVALAADPQKYRAAADRLKQMSGAASAPDFTTQVLPSIASPEPARASPITPEAAAGAPRLVRGTPDAFGQLEAFVMQTFIQTMLPNKADSVFGKGIAGEYWKSMLAEKLGNEIAQSGQLGLAKRLAGDRAATIGPRVDAAAADLAAGSIAPPRPLAGVLPYPQGEPPVPDGDATAALVPPASERS